VNAIHILLPFYYLCPPSFAEYIAVKSNGSFSFHRLCFIAISLIFLLYIKSSLSKSISLIIKTLVTAVKWSSGTLCAAQIALVPESSGNIWNTHASSLSAINNDSDVPSRRSSSSAP